MGKSKKIARPIGRPSGYTPELAALICEQIATGHSLNSILKQSGMPVFSTVYLWMNSHPEFSKMYALARENQAETHADGLVELADTATPETANAVKLMVDTRKWVAAKLKPRKYGDRTTTELTGADGGPVKVESTVAFDALLGKVEQALRDAGK